MTIAAAARDTKLPTAPFVSSVMQIEPQWIDYNGHLNMAYYNVMFDRAIDEFWLRLGIGPTYMKTRHGSTFTAECHVRYLREIHLGDPVQVSILLLGVDEKRLHTFEELRHAEQGWLSATSENVTVHVDIDLRKIPKPVEVALERWLLTFPSFGYILSVKPWHVAETVARFAARDIAAAAIGTVAHGNRVTISDGISSETIWDFAERPLIGAAPRAKATMGAVA